MIKRIKKLTLNENNDNIHRTMDGFKAGGILSAVDKQVYDEVLEADERAEKIRKYALKDSKSFILENPGTGKKITLKPYTESKKHYNHKRQLKEAAKKTYEISGLDWADESCRTEADVIKSVKNTFGHNAKVTVETMSGLGGGWPTISVKTNLDDLVSGMCEYCGEDDAREFLSYEIDDNLLAPYFDDENESYKRSNKIKRINESPDAYGLPTDDELDQEFQAKKAEAHRRRAGQDAMKNAYPVALDLLSIEEAEKLPRQVRKYDRCWWLKTPGTSTRTLSAAQVYENGEICSSGENIVLYYNLVRPALTLSNLDSSALVLYKQYGINNEEWIYIGDNRFLYNDEPVEHRFDGESNDYRRSEIKQCLDGWLKNLQSKYSKNESYRRQYKTKKMNEGWEDLDSYRDTLFDLIEDDTVDAKDIAKDLIYWCDEDNIKYYMEMKDIDVLFDLEDED